MSVFQPLRSTPVRRSVFVAGGLVKAVTLAAAMWPREAQAQQNQAVNIRQIGGLPVLPAICDNSTGVLSTVINIGTTQVQVVGGSTNRIYVCGWNFTTGDSSNLVKWVEGTSTDCISGQTDKSGTYNLSSKSPMVVTNAGFTQFITSSGASLCIDATSTGVYGLLTYKVST